jgi:hypothetical protein
LSVVSQRITDSGNVRHIAAARADNGFKVLLCDTRRCPESRPLTGTEKDELEKLIGAPEEPENTSGEDGEEKKTAQGFDLLAVGIRDAVSIKQKDLPAFIQSVRAIAKEREYDFVIFAVTADRAGKDYLGIAARLEAAVLEIDLRRDTRSDTTETVGDIDAVSKTAGVIFDNSGLIVFKRS